MNVLIGMTCCRRSVPVMNPKDPSVAFKGALKYMSLWEKELAAWGLYSSLPQHRDFASWCMICRRTATT